MTTENVIFEVLQATGLNWTVNKFPSEFTTYEEQHGLMMPVTHTVPNQFHNVRSDNNVALGSVGKDYKILQNHEAVEMVYKAGTEVFSKDLDIKHPWNNAETLGTYGNMAGGSLKGGASIFVQLELPSAYVGKSDVERFLTVTNHHTGNGALGFGTTNQVVCCANTFAIAQKALSKIRHTASMEEKIEDAIINLRKMLEFEDRQMEVFEKAANMPLAKKHIQEVLETIFGKGINNGDISTKKKNQVLEFTEDFNKSIDEQGETVWSLFNGVTRYTNHTRAVKDKDYSLMFGADAKTNQDVYNLMESWVN